MTYVLSFDSAVAVQPEFCGGKGANLSLLTQRGFKVPPGFVVTAASYREFAAQMPSLRTRLAELEFGNHARLHEQAEALSNDLRALPLPEAVVTEIRVQLARFPVEQAFSVRSSATFEDMAGAAFAGQHDTFLNCIGVEQVLERVRDCYLSLWRDRAIAYRHQLNFDHSQVVMAVVVQQMIHCEVAGVGFTINPVSGKLDEMLINANYGLGESVVSGDGEIDQYRYNKTGQLIDSTIGNKTKRIVCGTHGTREEILDAAAAQAPCLDASQLTQLAELMLRVEACYQFPQDIEWGIAGGELFLLQSRPVTVIPPRWTRDESAERFPNAVTPLTWDMVEEGFHRSLNHSLKLMGHPAFNGKWFGLHEHYIYGNQNAVDLYGRRAPLQIRNLADLEAMLPQLSQRFDWVLDLPVQWSRDLDHYLLCVGEFMAEPLADKSLLEVWQFVLRVNVLGQEYFLTNIAISLTQRTLYGVLHALLRMVLGDAAQAAAMFDDLMAHCETKTGAINRELVVLAAQIRDDEQLQQLLAGETSRKIIESQQLQAFPVFYKAFTRLLRNHGHRETDFDPYQPTWFEAPWVVLDTLRAMRNHIGDDDPLSKELQQRARMQQATDTLIARLPESLRFFFHELLRLARAYTTLDDVEHYHTTRLTLPIRKGLQELGHRLVRRGVLSEAMDVFFARFAALKEAVEREEASLWDQLARDVKAAKTDYLAHRDTPPSWVLGASDAVLGADENGMLRGLAGSPGLAEGEVFIINSPDDFAHFPKNAVLVARTTNPAWTPLFYSACAVITESGGPLSHGAVTAREMRIPAVMSVHGVLSALSNGQRVRIDGAAGKVWLV